MDKYELQKLRDLPIEGVAERLGLHVVRHKALCPFHDDHHASLSFCVRKNTFRCFVCGASGGTIDLVMKYLNKDFKEACRWLQTHLLQTLPQPLPIGRGGDTPASDNQGLQGNYSPPFREGSGESRFDASRYARFFEHPFLNDAARHFLFEERRIDPRVVRWCRLTSWKDRQGIPWLQIPYYNIEGKLVGVQNRNLTPSLPPRGEALSHSPSGETEGGHSGETERGHPRFRFPQGSKCGIYNLPVLNLLKPGDELYIAEGCSDCWALLSAGHKAIAIPSATLLSKQDMELLSALHASPAPAVTSHPSAATSHAPAVTSHPSAVTSPAPAVTSHSSAVTSHPSAVTFHMYPDRDVPGERLFLQLQKVLPSLIHHQLPPGCKDYSEYYLQTKVDTAKCPSGA